MKYTNFILNIHPKDKPAVGCGYYYTITSGAMSHTAFRTAHALKIWLKVTGLKIGRRIGPISYTLTGAYTRHVEMLNTKEFNNKYGHLNPFYALDNGDYTLGFYEENKEGNILHIQNPNTDRYILDYKRATAILETGNKWAYLKSN